MSKKHLVLFVCLVFASMAAFAQQNGRRDVEKLYQDRKVHPIDQDLKAGINTPQTQHQATRPKTTLQVIQKGPRKTIYSPESLRVPEARKLSVAPAAFLKYQSPTATAPERMAAAKARIRKH